MPLRRIPLRRKSLCGMTKSERHSKTRKDSQNPQMDGFAPLTFYSSLREKVQEQFKILKNPKIFRVLKGLENFGSLFEEFSFANYKKF